MNNIQTLQAIYGNDSQLVARVNFRRGSRLIKASGKKTQAQKIASTRESNPSQSHLLLHKRLRITPVVQAEKRLDPASIPWNKDMDDPCNLTFGED